MAQTTKQVDVLIITALEEERQAVLKLLPDSRMLDPDPADSRRPYYAEAPVRLPSGATGKYNVVIVRCGMGRVPATGATTRALLKWRPRYVILVGIAGGNEDQGVQVGDLLIATSIIDYESKKLLTVTEVDGSKVMDAIDRPRAFEIGGRLLEAARDVKVEDVIRRVQCARPDAQPPRIHFGPVASGDKVVSYKAVMNDLSRHYRELKGVEMEAGGVAAAVLDQEPSPGLLMVRGVSDPADERKDRPDVEQWREYACAIPAAFTMVLLESGPLPIDEIEEDRTDGIEPFELADVHVIAELLNDTRLAAQNGRRSLCLQIEVNPNQVPFLNKEGDSDFAHDLVEWLNNRVAVRSLNLLFDLLETNLGGYKKESATQLRKKLSRKSG